VFISVFIFINNFLMEEQVGNNKPNNAVGISNVSDLETSIWYQSIANHRRTEDTNRRNLKNLQQ